MKITVKHGCIVVNYVKITKVSCNWAILIDTKAKRPESSVVSGDGQLTVVLEKDDYTTNVEESEDEFTFVKIENVPEGFDFAEIKNKYGVTILLYPKIAPEHLECGDIIEWHNEDF